MGFPRWAPSISGGSVYNFNTGVDGGGSFSVNRYYAEAGISRMWDFNKMISFSAGVGQDDYRFSDPGSGPWNNIENRRIGVFARWALENNWAFFGASSIRSYGETGVAIDDSLTAAVFGGASYTFNDRLKIGPGLGVVGQLEDNPSVFPVVIVNWGITDKLRLETGGGLAASGGPGLSLNYAISSKWEAGLTTRYEKKRFRLDSDGPAPDGVGEDKNIPVYGSISYRIYPQGMIGAIIGFGFDGSFAVESKNGGVLYKKSYDNFNVLGLVASFRF